MPILHRRLASTILLAFVLFVNLLQFNIVLADDSTPPPPPTEEPTQPPEESSPTVVPVSATPDSPTIEPLSASDELTLLPDLLEEVPDNTEIVVMDENGLPVPLASQEAVEIILETDPIWCPEGILPGGSGCSDPYTTIEELRSNMVSNTSAYTQNGVIYFTATAGGSLNFSQSTLTLGDYNTLKVFNLTFQGGWNGSTVTPEISGQTNFANNRFTIGTTLNPWAGNITLKDLAFSNGNNTSLTIITSSGNITLDNVDITNQIGNNAAALTSTSGNITIQNNSLFDGDNFNGNGVTATTGSGTITITDATFQQFKRSGDAANTWDGLTLSAPTVTLTNVTSTNNDGDGISITNANIVTLNNVISSFNGTELGTEGLTGNDGSGAVVSGPAGSIVQIIGGTFNNNQEYGIEIVNPANTTLFIQTAPTCTGNDSNAAPTSSCYNTTTVTDSTGPVITPSISGTLGSLDWYRSDVSVSWTLSDPESNIYSSTGCSPTSLTSETSGTTLTCSATNNAGLSSTVSVTIKIDKTAPTASANRSPAANGSGWNNTSVTVSFTGTDASSGIASCTAPALLSTEGAGQSASGTCTDLAGNTSPTATASGIKIDFTDPALNVPADITTEATGASGAVVNFSASASDNLDPSPIFNCSQVSGDIFPVGTTIVNCTATDQAGNSSSASFTIFVTTKTISSSTVQQTQQGGSIIVVTGGEQVILGCFTELYAFGIKLTFLNLCGHQTVVNSLDQESLPASLPSGFTFLSGLDVQVLKQGKALEDLPDNTGIKFDFPSPDAAKYALLFWDGSTWIEINDSISETELNTLLTDALGDELFRIGSTGNGHSKALTTGPTGIFVLVTK